eukprot:COSAG01_NODE_3811_length_5675_cov_6.241930_5_plen_83_part_00
MSAFLYACEHGYPDVVARLMEAGCAQHATNRENYSGAPHSLLKQHAGGEGGNAVCFPRQGRRWPCVTELPLRFDAFHQRTRI